MVRVMVANPWLGSLSGVTIIPEGWALEMNDVPIRYRITKLTLNNFKVNFFMDFGFKVNMYFYRHKDKENIIFLPNRDFFFNIILTLPIFSQS